MNLCEIMGARLCEMMGEQGVKEFGANITLADLWLQGMAEGARAHNITILYCMPYASMVLAAAGHPSVTTARASHDYSTVADNFAIGGTALFYWAVGILPFKDGFYSSNMKQVGGANVGPEQTPDRHALVATLSGAIVAPMDGLGLMNATRVMQTCRKDGVVLKPDRPLVTTDASKPHIKTTH